MTNSYHICLTWPSYGEVADQLVHSSLLDNFDLPRTTRLGAGTVVTDEPDLSKAVSMRLGSKYSATDHHPKLVAHTGVFLVDKDGKIRYYHEEHLLETVKGTTQEVYITVNVASVDTRVPIKVLRSDPTRTSQNPEYRYRRHVNQFQLPKLT